MDVMKREREKALLEARREREDGEAEDGEEEDGEEEEEEDGEEVPRKRARHDSDSDGDGEADDRDDRDDRDDSKETKNATDVARAEDAAAEEVALPAQQPDDKEEATPAKTLLDVVLSLFTEQETLRKKEIVAAAERSGVEFKDSEYSKLMKQIATSKPGGKWVKNA